MCLASVEVNLPPSTQLAPTSTKCPNFSGRSSSGMIADTGQKPIAAINRFRGVDRQLRNLVEAGPAVIMASALLPVDQSTGQASTEGCHLLPM